MSRTRGVSMRIVKTAWGRMAVAATPQGVCDVTLRAGARRLPVVTAPSMPPARTHLDRAIVELREYLSGRRRAFTVELDTSAGTPFQRAVWRAAAAVPYGETRTYGQIAAAIGRPSAARAVGGALHANPVPLFVPCHRVVADDGRLGGFACGLALKQQLLRHEQRRARPLRVHHRRARR